nr:uncharacterized protein LOC113811181 [Penaeus vannamei]
MASNSSLLILLALSLYTHAAELKTKEGNEENEGRYISDSQIFTLGTVNIRSLILFSLGALLVLALLAVTATTPREAGVPFATSARRTSRNLRLMNRAKMFTGTWRKLE